MLEPFPRSLVQDCPTYDHRNRNRDLDLDFDAHPALRELWSYLASKHREIRLFDVNVDVEGQSSISHLEPD